MKTFNKIGVVIMGLVIAGLAGNAGATLTPIVQWSFENNLNDTSGTGNNGVLSSGTASYVGGAFGQGISLAVQSVDKTAASSVPTLGTDAWSMNVWFNLSATPGNLAYLAGFGEVNNSGGSGKQRGYIQFGAGYYFWGSSADLDSGVAYTANNTWNMYTMTFSGGAGGTLSMYTNGVLVATGSPGLTTVPVSQLHVGAAASNWNVPFSGRVDEYTVWTNTLTGAQISNLYSFNSTDALVAAVPEPSTILLMLVGGGAIWRWRRRQQG